MADAQKRRKVRLKKNLRRSIQRGHPWLFDRAVQPGPALAAGELVEVADERGPIAVAFADPDSPIRLRILDLDSRARIGSSWLHHRVQRAAERRRDDPSLADTSALRLIHGEADGIPGLVVDTYAEHGIALVDGAAAEAVWVPKLDIVKRALRDGGFDLATLAVRRVGRERKWIGKAPPEEVLVHEGEAHFRVDLHRGQKTGLFLDQRENRRLVGQRAAGLSVLNLFGYNGGFSLAAALGGAEKTTTVDIAGPAIESARANFELSGLDPKGHEFVTADVFDFLERALEQERRFDLVICDPPSFASSEKALAKGLKAYTRVNEMALRSVARGGVFCSASCSSHVTDRHLLEVLADASRQASRELVVTDHRGAASDHPVRPGFPEGRYLDFFLCAVD